MTDDVKKPSELLDQTAPMPVPRGQTKDPTTDEATPPFLDDTDPRRNAKPTSSLTDDTVVRTGKPDAHISSAPLEPQVPRSFDDEVAQRKVAAARPARGLTAAFARPARPPEVTPDADTTPTRGTARAGDGTSADGSPPTVEAPASSSDVFAGALREQGADPLARSATAPIMSADDVESIPTAPIPMLTGMHARDLRYDEPSLPKPRLAANDGDTQASAPQPVDGIESAPRAPIGDGIELTGPAPYAGEAPAEQTVERTAAYNPSFAAAETALVSRAASGSIAPSATAPNAAGEASGSASSRASVLANEATRLKAAPRARIALPLAALVGAGAGLVVVVAIVVGLRVVRAREAAPLGDAAPIVEVALAKPVEVTRALEPTSPITKPAAPVEIAKPVEIVNQVPPAPVDAIKPADVVAPPALPLTTPPAPTQPVDVAATPALRPPAPPSAPVMPSRDGFGPFVNRAAVDAPGIGQALGRGVRALLGDDAFSAAGKWSGLGVRGEVRRAQVRDKVASVDCALTIVDARGARLQLSATGTAPVEGARDAALRNAADRCGRSLDADLKSALDHARRE